MVDVRTTHLADYRRNLPMEGVTSQGVKFGISLQVSYSVIGIRPEFLINGIIMFTTRLYSVYPQKQVCRSQERRRGYTLRGVQPRPARQ